MQNGYPDIYGKIDEFVREWKVVVYEKELDLA